MPFIFCKGSGVHQILQTLPRDQIRHSSHVKLFVCLLAAKIGGCGLYTELMNTTEYGYFGDAALYHDIGKVWVPQQILSKPGKLTAEETRMIQKHTLFAEELFKLIGDGSVSGMPEHLLHLAHDAAVYHHEWWNGQGYPYGLSHEEIPLVARITSVCDVYDAITSDRPYRKAHSHEFVCREIEENAGTQFDPAIVDVFLDNEAVFSSLVKKENNYDLISKIM